MTFPDVAARVLSLYREDDYKAALAIAQDARISHPEEDNLITFWEACLQARLGRTGEALETLQAGIERGEWWPTGKLVDTDLDPVRGEPGWDVVHSHCAEKTQRLMDDRPETMVRHGTGSGTLIAIQGAHAIPEEFFNTWSGATPDRWTVTMPIPSEPTGEGGWEWPHSIGASARSVTSDLQKFDLRPPVILAGFSIGSAIACHLINATAQPVDGLIAIAPSTTGDFEELIEATSSLRSLVICGDQDTRVDGYRDVQSQVGERELVIFDLIGGLGHAYPADLDKRIGQFLTHF